MVSVFWPIFAHQQNKLFGVDQVKLLVGGSKASGRRVGLFMSDNSASVWSGDGQPFFDKALDWVTPKVTYRRDPANNIVARTVGAVTVRYGSAGISQVTQTSTGTTIEASYNLPGGVGVTVNPTTGNIWALPNLHGDVMVTTTLSGARIGNGMPNSLPTMYTLDGQTLARSPTHKPGRLITPGSGLTINPSNTKAG